MALEPVGILDGAFFDRDTRLVARELLGAVLRRRWRGSWLSARIIETEAYEASERGSHASLGRTPSREPLFMAPGTIYMYFSRAGDSLNVSTRGAGNAVLIKSAFPHFDARSGESTLRIMQKLSPSTRPGERRSRERICAGQTLLCRALSLHVRELSGRRFDPERFYIEAASQPPEAILRARRLGISEGRDEHLLWRFIDAAHARHCTSNPRTKRGAREGVDWCWDDPDAEPGG
ncbi:MAG: DNA-3-methyladenine glycosylase [Myxococcales bacterium]|nr:DNA-3-methyladenine glycosylase [Myxococcales bacterium]